jgi:hypothetical protein
MEAGKNESTQKQNQREKCPQKELKRVRACESVCVCIILRERQKGNVCVCVCV